MSVHSLAAPRVAVMLPYVVVGGAVMRVRNATLLERPDGRIMGNSCGMEGRKAAECRAWERAQCGRLVGS